MFFACNRLPGLPPRAAIRPCHPATPSQSSWLNAARSIKLVGVSRCNGSTSGALGHLTITKFCCKFVSISEARSKLAETSRKSDYMALTAESVVARSSTRPIPQLMHYTNGDHS